MIETRDTTLGPMVSGTREELEVYVAKDILGRDSPVMVQTVEAKLNRIEEALRAAGINHVDIIYDEESDKVRYYKKALALEGRLDDNVITIAHKLGWHKFE